MSQEFCGVTWRKDSAVASRLISSRKSLWNLFYQQRHCWCEMFPFSIKSSFHLDFAFLSCKPSYLTVFPPEPTSIFLCWLRSWTSQSSLWLWGHVAFPSLECTGILGGELIRFPSMKCRKYSAPSSCSNFSQQFPKLCEGQKLISSYSIFHWFWSFSVFLSISRSCSAVMGW